MIGVLNWPLFRFLARATSWGEAILCFPLLLVYLATCVCGLIAGLALAEHRQDRRLWPAAGMIGLVLLTLQILGGAYTAEFMGHADEAAQFVSGLMVYDYLATLPRENPIDWAGQYYLHYPKVAIGHWPPGYPAMEGLWWLMLGPSRVTAMLLQWLIGVVALTDALPAVPVRAVAADYSDDHRTDDRDAGLPGESCSRRWRISVVCSGACS